MQPSAASGVGVEDTRVIPPLGPATCARTIVERKTKCYKPPVAGARPRAWRLTLVRRPSLAAPPFALLVLAIAALAPRPLGGQTTPLSLDKLTLKGVVAEQRTYQGRSAIRLVEADKSRTNVGIAIVSAVARRGRGRRRAVDWSRHRRLLLEPPRHAPLSARGPRARYPVRRMAAYS